MDGTPLINKRLDELFGLARPTRWVTRARPKIDRIACPWLIRRFIDPDAAFLYVLPDEVFAVANRERAVAYDVPGARFAHVGDRCSFDAFLAAFELSDPALATLANVIRAADTGRAHDNPQAPGLLAISLGLSAQHADDHAVLEAGMIVYDALHAWARGDQTARKGKTTGAPP